jgi:hypothetical protein
MAKVEPVKREVIERQLLATLNDKSKVACVFDYDDLTLLINVLESSRLSDKQLDMLESLKQLRGEAFGIF